MNDGLRQDKAHVSYLDVVALLWSQRVPLITIILVLSCVVLFLLSRMSDVYRSEALLIPMNDYSSMHGFKRGGSEFSYLNGISIGSDINRADLIVEILRSRLFVENFLQKYSLFEAIYSVGNWDSQLDRSQLKFGGYESERWESLLGGRKRNGSTRAEDYNKFTRNLSVVMQVESGFLRIAYQHPSPHFARATVGNLINEVNRHIRNRDLRQTVKNIRYLNHEIDNPAFAALRPVLFNLLVEQTELAMLASSGGEYAFKIIDPAFVPEKAFSPNRPALFIVVFVAIVLFSCSLVCSQIYFKGF